MILSLLVSCILDATVGSCGGSPVCEHVEYFQQTATLDLLLVLDSSPSMADDTDRLADALPELVRPLLRPHIDVHLGVLSMDMSGDAGALIAWQGQRWADNGQSQEDAAAWLAEAARHLPPGGADERGLDAVIRALVAPSPTENEGFRREEVPLSLVLLSDEDDASSIDPMDFGVQLTSGRADLLTAHAIVPVDTSCTETIGARYLEVVDATGGAALSVCEPSPGPFLSAVAQLEALRSRRDSFLLEFPALPEGLSVRVSLPDGSSYELQPQDYALARAGTELVLRSLPPPPGSELEVRYTAAPMP